MRTTKKQQETARPRNSLPQELKRARNDLAAPLILVGLDVHRYRYAPVLFSFFSHLLRDHSDDHQHPCDNYCDTHHQD